ncbi:MAG: hypothetical protein ACYTG4_03625 [Planctomycetota bacterium]|jgi:hypothetical protein
MRVTATGRRAVALSTWLDSGRKSPWWQDPEIRPLVDREAVRIDLQGAPARVLGGGPDLKRATAWGTDPANLAGMRYVRFRVVFDVNAPLEARFIDDLALPFVSR